MDEKTVIETYLPESVKETVRTFQMHKFAERITGLNDFSLAKIAEYLGGRMAARRMKWRPVTEGLNALRSL
jgi:hypothetical protein